MPLSIGDEWYGWIPTNLGEIQFEFISKENLKPYVGKNFEFEKSNKEIKIKNLDVSFISDSSHIPKIVKKIIELIKRKEEISPKANFCIKQGQDNVFKGEIELFFKDLKFVSSFALESDGKAFFKLTHIHNPENIKLDDYNDFDSYEIKQIIYFILKFIIHFDKHHNLKLDTALRISENNFNKHELMHGMLLHIKRVEKNVRDAGTKCWTRFKQAVSVHEVEGYIAYMKTFAILFNTDKKQLEIAYNIKKSLETIVRAREEKYKTIKVFKEISLTFVALFIAINVLINSFYSKEILASFFVNEYNRWTVFLFSLVIFISLYIFFVLCDLISYLFFYHYKLFVFLRNLSHLSKPLILKFSKVLFFIGLLIFLIGIGLKYVIM